MALTQEQTKIIKATVPVLVEHGETITSRFYGNMLRENPSLNNIFNHTNQVNHQQPIALAKALYAYATHIDDLGALSPAVELICNKHASLYVQPEQYDIVGKYLLGAMGEVLGDAFTPAIEDAWKAAYFQLAGVMINREAGLYQSFNGWTNWREFRIAKKVPESSVITSFYFEPLDGQPLPSHLPGQYVSVLVNVPALGHDQARQYSISSAYNGKYIRISVKREDGSENEKAGYVSNVLHANKEEGDIVKLSHPAGDFFLDPKRDGDCPLVLISAGVGLTPMMAILESLLQSGDKRKVSWIHGTHETSVQAFKDVISKVVAEHPNIKSVIFNRNPADGSAKGVDYHFTSRMDLDLLDRDSQLFLQEGAKYYICGPDAFMTDMEEKLKSYGVPDSRVYAERFGTGGPPSSQ